jgi:hypothetical protein
MGNGDVLDIVVHKNIRLSDIIVADVGAFHGNIPNVGNTGDQVTLTQIGIQVTAR